MMSHKTHDVTLWGRNMAKPLPNISQIRQEVMSNYMAAYHAAGRRGLLKPELQRAYDAGELLLIPLRERKGA